MRDLVRRGRGAPGGSVRDRDPHHDRGASAAGTAWIAELVTVALDPLPFTTDLALPAGLAGAGVLLAAGGTITGLLSGTAYGVASHRSREDR
ncbi:hypothetical protein GCM10010345_74310 [Streptomyces canarius]|uniref:Uncharacterized protein n=1 Tax=Streptomyces canarius TaxID=285453 RepID=A0ABQ3D6B0_9ACTN|nr:hypothetical protein GCM10010345_74310 [Streptomyces canarius]